MIARKLTVVLNLAVSAAALVGVGLSIESGDNWGWPLCAAILAAELGFSRLSKVQ